MKKSKKSQSPAFTDDVDVFMFRFTLHLHPCGLSARPTRSTVVMTDGQDG